MGIFLIALAPVLAAKGAAGIARGRPLDETLVTYLVVALIALIPVAWIYAKYVPFVEAKDA